MDPEKWKHLRLSGELSDLIVKVGERQFRLHKFPMMCSSDYFMGLLRSGMSDSANVTLDDLPGGEATMDLVADFCYQQRIEDQLTVANIGHVMGSCHYLQMKTLTATCTSKLKLLIDSDISNSLKILSNFAEDIPTMEAAGVTDLCVKAIANHWACWRCTNSSNTRLSACTQGNSVFYVRSRETVATWVKEMQNIPAVWVAQTIEALTAQKYPNWKELPVQLTDQFLTFYASQGCLSGPEFLLLLKASSSVSRASYDLPFQALEKLLACSNEDVAILSVTDIADIIQQMDFSKMSQESLERAAGNGHIPQSLTMMAAVAACSQFRAQLADKSGEVYRLQAQLKEYNMHRKRPRNSFTS